MKKLPIFTLSNRFTGIGFDQLLVIEPTDQADFFCRIFNADSSEAEQCGNGLRCVARFIHENKLHESNHFSIATIAGVFPVMIHDYENIEITFPAPVIANEMELIIDAMPITITNLSVGNPHSITTVAELEAISVSELGRKISTHEIFPHGTNAGFMQILNRSHARLRTYERGSGETLACGSNACAAAAAGIIGGLLDNKVNIEFALGTLQINWAGGNAKMKMIGPAAQVFDGEFDI